MKSWPRATFRLANPRASIRDAQHVAQDRLHSRTVRVRKLSADGRGSLWEALAVGGKVKTTRRIAA